MFFLDFSVFFEAFPCFSLSCKANARVKLATTGHGPHSSTLVVICVLRLFVLFYVLFVCKCVLPLGDNPIAVNKYIKINTNNKTHSDLHVDCPTFLLDLTKFGFSTWIFIISQYQVSWTSVQ